MFEVEIKQGIDCAHQLHLPYDSPCNRPHGHRYEITVKVGAVTLNENGMVVDFSVIKDIIKSYDHKDLNQCMVRPSTAECFAAVLHGQICAAWPDNKQIEFLSVTVSETPSTKVTYGGVLAGA
jgi:6-pyruvoyltetrahydropterin/6-carboxytetrahydropterin synthase